MKVFLAAALMMTTAVVCAQEQTLRFKGYAYDDATGKYLYTELHEQRVKDDQWLSGSIGYYAPDGQRMAYKTLDFTRNPFVPVYEIVMNYNGYREGISAVGETAEMFRQNDAQAKPERKSVPLRKQDMTADSGFHSLLRARFDELMQGKNVDFSFVVAGSLDTFKFRARKTADTQFDGAPAVKIEAELNSWLSLMAGPLKLIYEPRERRLLEYRGMSNIHDPKTGKPYESVRIIYPSTPPADAPKLPAL